MVARPGYRLELIILTAFILFLPLMEAPKNLAWLLYVLTWLFNRGRAGNFGGRWDRWDSLILVWILSGIAVASFAATHHKEWSGAWDLMRYGIILWCVKRAGYDKRSLLWLLVSLAVSTIIALAYAYWSLYVTHTRHALELHSVGHVNHSAIYLVIVYGLVLTGTLAYWHGLSLGWRLACVLVTGLLAASVVVSDSRAAVGVMLLLTLLLGIAWLRRRRAFLIALSAAVVVAMGMMFVFDAPVVEKYKYYIEKDDILNLRQPLWNSAVVAWKQFPLFGVGMSNYNQISMENVKVWVEESGRVYDESRYLGSSHAHSLYVTALAERGIIGLAVLLTVLLAWLYALLRHLPGRDDEDLYWALWGGSFSAWFVTIGIGFVNTTLHHEHAILSVLLLGLWLSSLKARRAQTPAS